MERYDARIAFGRPVGQVDLAASASSGQGFAVEGVVKLIKRVKGVGLAGGITV